MKRLIEKVALWALRRVGNVRHLGEGNALILHDRFGKEVCFKVPPPGNTAWEAGCTCQSDDLLRLDCPLHYLPKSQAVYVRLK
jgi:hypothetical protein